MAQQNYLIGVDIGTAGTKAAVFDHTGQLLTDAYEESQLTYPRPGWVEQEMDDFYRSACITLKRVVEKTNLDPGRVAALTFDGQMGGVGAIDGAWNPVTRYDSWLDTRCEYYIDLMNREAGGDVLTTTGAPVSYNHGPKILWWKHEAPQVFARIAKFVMPAGYVAGKMAGLAASDAFIDYTYLAHSGFADAARGSWNQGLLSAFGLSADTLPRIVPPWEIVGRLTPGAARATGLKAGTPITAGCGDQGAGLLGAGVVAPGQLADVAGTASCFIGAVPDFTPDAATGTFLCFRSVIPGLWYLMAYINGGGLCLRWFRDEFADTERRHASREHVDPYEILNRAAAPVSPGAEGLVFVPHLGGRVCPFNPHVKGSWFGCNWKHTRAHFYRAILEGIAYEYAVYHDILTTLAPKQDFSEARVIGGGAKSGLWNQIKANVLNLNYLRLNRSELPVLGGAVIGGHAVGLYPDLAEAARSFVQPTSPATTPDRAIHQTYQPYVKLYRQLLQAQEAPSRTLSRILAPESSPSRDS